jgi:hypothetical protein
MIGEGGMGVVYRAHDERLDRDVAIKVLPDDVAHDEARLSRFEREAKTVSQLSHPHICTLHDVGLDGDVHFLVMEFLEGESLAERLQRKPLPFDQALRYAVQIADGLDAAHRRGVVHRDLKPDNIVLTRVGPKLLDFGLAKLADTGSGEFPGALSALPTEARTLTENGAILGTLPYMAPEQLEGQEADNRTDIFAFGAVVYEMLTGRRAFEGKSQASLIAAILDHEPPSVSSAIDLAPPALDWTVKKCLAKDPDERWYSAHDLRDQLARIASGEPEATSRPAIAAGRYERIAWALAIVSMLTAMTLLLLWPSAEENARVFQLLLPEGHRPAEWSGGPAISPDGESIAFFSVDTQGRGRIWVRDLEAFDFRSLPGTADAVAPFWSPDGRFIGFFSGNEVKKVGLDGTPPETVCEMPSGFPRGGAWSRNGEILLAFGDEKVYKVPASGGQPEALYAQPDVLPYDTIVWPAFLPDGIHFVFLGLGYAPDGASDDRIYLGSLDSEKIVPLIRASSNAVYAPPGYLLFARDGTFLAHSFDFNRLRVQGDPIPIAGGLKKGVLGHWGFSASGTGVLAYASGSPMRPTWFDRRGRNMGEIGDAKVICGGVRLSPGETLVAMTCSDPDIGASDIYLHDVSRNATSRLTFDPAWDQWAVWSPRGDRVAYWTETELRQRFIERRGDYSILLSTESWGFKPTDWSPDEESIVLQTHERGVASDIMVVTTDGSGNTELVLRSRFSEIDGRFSPNGRWLAFASDESGRFEVYVQSYPEADRRYQVSFEGGRKPNWRGDGNELFYLAGDRSLVAVPVRTSPTFQLGQEERLFRTTLPDLVESTFSVSNDGQRFLLFSSPGPNAMNVILNWPALLERGDAE